MQRAVAAAAGPCCMALAGIALRRRRPVVAPRLVRPPLSAGKYSTRMPRVSSSSENKTKVKSQNFRQDDIPAHILWWKEKMQLLRKPSSVQLTKRLSYSNLLGLDVNLKNGRLKEGTLNMEILQFKSMFPREVLLCRVGDFYEAVGFDACILVEHAGLNPCGALRSDSVPKAGCPIVNLRQTVDDLTRCGFSVCIVEEVQGPTQARARKGRFISGHAHPGSPYVFGLAGSDHDVEFPDPMPFVGISRSAKGYCLISVLEAMRTYTAEDGLTEEAVVMRLRVCRYHYLYIHSSLRNNSSGTSRWGEYGEGGLLWAECHGKAFEWFDGAPVEELLCRAREIYGLGPEVTFRNVTVPPEGRPRPLGLGTATQIGVVTTEGIPSLLKVLLPATCVDLPFVYLRDLLLNPPPFEIAVTIQKICQLMSNVSCPIPEFTCMSAAKIVKLLESKEVNHIEFCRLKNVVDEIMHMGRNAELSAIVHALLKPVSMVTGLNAEYEILMNECSLISHRISDVISMESENDQKISSSRIIPDDFFMDMESSWKGRVKRLHAAKEFGEVDKAVDALSTAVMEDFLPIISRLKSVMSPVGGSKGEICYAREHEAIWFRGKRFTPNIWAGTPGEEQIKQLRPATDMKGRKAGEEWFTTSKVDHALNRYHEACDNAKNKVLELLRALSSELQNKTNVLVFCTTLLIIAKSLFCHVSEGRRRGWVFPTFSSLSGVEKSSESVNEMELTGLFPYWLNVNHDSVILNDVKMQSLFILTGPNGGGKSSLLRSICAAALLGTCGLMVPAASAIIPCFDVIMLHMKTYDSPADSKSSFQIEMSEIRSLVRQATNKSLVLVDEICRGTETAKGTCIAGSLVETLDRVGCLGIVSTHLHGLFDLPLSVGNTSYKALGTEIVNGRIRPTWRLRDGICRESLAFQTALNEGIPESIVRRAEELYVHLNMSYVSNAKDTEHNGSKLYPTSNPVGTFYSLCDSSELSRNFEQLEKEVQKSVISICQKKLSELYSRNSSSQPSDVSCVVVRAREQPPPSTVGCSCVYIIIRPDRRLYVGQTDNLEGRLRAHRSKEGMQGATALYIVVPGKSVACLLETLLINQLPLQNFHLVNKSDGKHCNFGTSVPAAIALQQ